MLVKSDFLRGRYSNSNSFFSCVLLGKVIFEFYNVAYVLLIR